MEDEEIKVSELAYTELIMDNDYFMIIQSKANKKITFSSIRQKIKKELEKEFNGEEIYNDSDGINTSFSLTKGLQGKEKIKVYYVGRNSAIGDDIECMKEIPVVNGEVNSSLEALYAGESNLWIMRTGILISGTSVNLSNNIINIVGMELQIRQEQSIYITKIIAF